MPHPPELIHRIKEKIIQSYPENDGYEYVVEKAVAFNKKRIFPDIQIIKGKKIYCVVEIGYTRPEKIKYYRKIGIKDIRWYSKEGELINEPVETEIIIRKFVPNPEQEWTLLNFCKDCFCDIDCDDCASEVWDDEELIDEEKIEEIFINNSYIDVCIGTNSVQYFLFCFCDLCGKYFIEYSDIGTDLTIQIPFKDQLVCLENYNDFSRYENRLKRSYNSHEIVTVKWHELFHNMEEKYGLILNLDKMSKF